MEPFDWNAWLEELLYGKEGWLMPNVIWKCVNDDGDVKYAAREAHVDILEAKGYVCELAPDPDFDTLTIWDVDSDKGSG
jgi:hypothetical protein